MPRGPQHLSWYRVAVARPNAPAQIFAAEGAHLGEAIAAAEAHTKSYAIGADVATEAPLGESLRRAPPQLLGEDTEMPVFRWPRGVIPKLGAAAGLAKIRQGWIERPDSKLLVLEAVTDAENLVDLFLGVIERLPAADNLEVRLLDHFEDAGVTNVWLTSRVNARAIIRLLDDHDTDIIENGHVEVSVYVRAHKATLRLTEHKTVVWLAEDRALDAEMRRWFGELKIPAVDSLVTVNQVPHFHYRPAKSRDRKKLGDELFRQRLRVVDTVKPDGRETEA